MGRLLLLKRRLPRELHGAADLRTASHIGACGKAMPVSSRGGATRSSFFAPRLVLTQTARRAWGSSVAELGGNQGRLYGRPAGAQSSRKALENVLVRTSVSRQATAKPHWGRPSAERDGLRAGGRCNGLPGG